MKQKERKQILKYIVADFLTANIAWFLFNIVRFDKSAIYQGYWELHEYLLSHKVFWGQIIIPFVWIGIYYYSGYYNRAFRKSRLMELTSTLFCTLIGSILIFFSVLLNDLPPFYELYYKLCVALFSIHFILTYSVRFCITQTATNKIHHRKLKFNTIIIGTGTRAFNLYTDLNRMTQSLGYNVLGFILPENEHQVSVPKKLILGEWEDLESVITPDIEDIIVVTENNEEKEMERLYSLYKYGIPVKILATKHDILLGNVKMTTIYDKPMYELFVAFRSDIDKNIKKTLDVIISFFVLLLLSPLYLFLAVRIKLNDPKSSIFFAQERIGKGGKPFLMYKFRTMNPDAECEGPSLSMENDPRNTAVGSWMRKYRLDELPQFWNVLKGDMSVVGPRPERQFFIREIVKKAPFFYLLYQVKPGITSWGMVKYGYAQSVNEMIERLDYDIIYLENMSLFIDLKILIYTIKTVLMGKGI
ncbi:MAG: sugar transferase [Candidatus Azobacteroides sp.]|nr:sugar transferase [Candidatus Azobacteroides sp.]